MIKGSLMLHLGPIWYQSEPSDVPYSQNLPRPISWFGLFLQQNDSSSYISLFIFASEVLKLLRTVGVSKHWGQVVIQGLLKDKVLPLYLAKSKGAIAHPAPRLRRPFYHGSYRFLYLFVQ